MSQNNLALLVTHTTSRCPTVDSSTGDTQDSEALIYTSPAFNLTPFNVVTINTSGLTSIADVSVFDGSGEDITGALEVLISGTSVTVEANNALTNLILKAIGE